MTSSSTSKNKNLNYTLCDGQTLNYLFLKELKVVQFLNLQG